MTYKPLIIAGLAAAIASIVSSSVEAQARFVCNRNYCIDRSTGVIYNRRTGQPVGTQNRQPTQQPGRSTSPASGQTDNSMAREILIAHNKYREEVNVPPLTWSNELANHAREWANYLADQGKFEHSTNRNNEGENLWMGTRGAYSYTQMVDSWGSEKQYFVNGNFPNVSSTGNWADVGHYTQIIWRNTTQVGCATADGRNGTVLVCRYSPPGNYVGQRTY